MEQKRRRVWEGERVMRSRIKIKNPEDRHCFGKEAF
jgi:hypothetical protein